MSSKPLLITSAIAPPSNFSLLAMQNSDMRKATTKASIFFWVGQGIKELVVVDSTATKVLNKDDQEMLNRLGVRLEQFDFKQDNEKVRANGLGYAEGNLIKYALDNSELIAKSGSFFKCTGKVFCRNFQEILSMIESKNISSIFWQRFPFIHHLAETRFFFVSVKAFNEYVLPTYLSTDLQNIVETKLVQVLGSKLSTSYEIRPLITGFSGGPGNQLYGGHGHLYEEKCYGDLDLKFPCWLSITPKKGLYV
ncbi:hypothetical protein G6703_04980 [Polynucleobacter paneuropaeus]|jgi:hypothetical protein|nr:hypothetical protein G6703_04980 [Polynucleobacter paneuropaeus]